MPDRCYWTIGNTSRTLGVGVPAILPSTRGASLNLHFSLPLAHFETAWLGVLCLFVLLVLAYGGVRLRMEQTRRILKQRVEERHAERERIARDLHDTLMQGIQALLFRLQLWANDASMPLERRVEIAAVVTQARQITIECRERLLELRAARVERPDFVGSLEAMGATESTRKEVRFDVIGSGTRRDLRPEASDQLLLIAREAVRNAFRHSRGTRIEVHVLFKERSLGLRILDDGVGVDSVLLQARQRAGHFGLISMRERAAQLGASFELDSSRATGTSITVTVPGAIAFPRRSQWPWARRQSGAVSR